MMVAGTHVGRWPLCSGQGRRKTLGITFQCMSLVTSFFHQVPFCIKISKPSKMILPDEKQAIQSASLWETFHFQTVAITQLVSWHS